MKLSKNALSAIGNTPLIKLSKIIPSDSANVWIKLEYVNPGVETMFVEYSESHMDKIMKYAARIQKRTQVLFA